ncbi:hypothetical protein ACHAXR_004991 [Thalassiosira sp. AJA248-18]
MVLPVFKGALDRIVTEELMATLEGRRKQLFEDVMCYVIFGFCNGLRGEEVPLISLAGLRHFWEETAMDAEPYIMTTLHGRFKGELDERWHCLPIPIPDATASGIPARKWISQKLQRCTDIQGRTGGPFFLNAKGKRAKMSDYNEEFRRLIGEVKLRYPLLIHKDATPELFSLWRSMRRGATLATTGKVGKDIIDLYHRWRSIEGGKGGVPAGLDMQQTYLHVRSCLPQLRMYGAVL